eukprot:2900096-Amphidinium_carterae.1
MTIDISTNELASQLEHWFTLHDTSLSHCHVIHTHAHLPPSSAFSSCHTSRLDLDHGQLADAAS